MFSYIGMDYSQCVLIDKINQYQKLKGRPLISTRGYCHGLAVLWLSKMAQQKVEWFYDMIRYIIHNKPQDYDEASFEKFLALIEFGQNPLNSGLNITHRHLRILLEMDNIESTSFVGKYPNLFKKIRPKKHPGMYLIAHGDHAIAAFHKGDNYYVYDSNYFTGEAKMFDSKENAAKEIMARLLSKAEQKEDEDFELEFNYIPLNHLSHPSSEVVIDMSVNDGGYEADEEEKFSSGWQTSSCNIL